MLYNLYVGSNNRTKRLELAKIRKATAARFDGFSLMPLTGYWKGTAERSVMVQIETMDRAAVMELVEMLKLELEQEAIALQELPALRFI